MTVRSTRRPSLEVLENRWCPAVTAEVIDGSLLIASDDASRLGIDQIGDNAFRVTDGEVLVGEFADVTKDVVATLGDGDDRARIDLGLRTTPGNVSVDLGDGNNALSLQHGTVGGDLTIVGGNGIDRISLGSDPRVLSPLSPRLLVRGNAAINAGSMREDALVVQPHATVGGDLLVHSANNFELAHEAAVGHDLAIRGGPRGNAVLIAGGVRGGVRYGSEAAATDFIALARTAEIDGFFADLGNRFTSLKLNGRVRNDVAITGGDGSVAVQMGGVIGGSAEFAFTHGLNGLRIAGTIGGDGDGPTLVVTGGRGSEHVVLTRESRILGAVALSLDGGPDSLWAAGIIGSPERHAGLRANLGAGDDIVTLTESAVVYGKVGLGLDGGDDIAVIAGAIGTGDAGNELEVAAGEGKDLAFVTASARVRGAFSVDMGAGADLFVLAGGARFESAAVDGGPGFDIFIGNPRRVALANFEVIIPI